MAQGKAQRLVRELKWGLSFVLRYIGLTITAGAVLVTLVSLGTERSLRAAVSQGPLLSVGERQSGVAGDLAFAVGPIVRSPADRPPSDMPLLPSEADAALAVLDCPVRKKDGACARWKASRMTILDWTLVSDVLPDVYRQRRNYVATRNGRNLYMMNADGEYTIVAAIGSDSRSLVPYRNGLGPYSTAAIVRPGRHDVLDLIETEASKNRSRALTGLLIALCVATLTGILPGDGKSRLFLFNLGPAVRRAACLAGPLLLAFLLPDPMSKTAVYLLLGVAAFGGWATMLMMALFRRGHLGAEDVDAVN